MNWLEHTAKSVLKPSVYTLITDKDEIERLCSNVRKYKQNMVLKSELKDAGISAEKHWLQTIISHKDKVIVIWPDDKYGLMIDYPAFVDHYDDFWYPSRDDVWMIDKADFSWVIELDHEEIFRFYSKTLAAYE